MNINEKLKKLRIATGLSGVTVASSVNIHPTQLRRYEDSSKLTVDDLKKLADYYKQDIKYFFTD